MQATATRIERLSTQLSNQIAAGEVIERPASVVKELLENSVDAGSRRIQIDIEQGGVQLIQIRDDGCGVHREDLPLSIARHATSKIHSFDDLMKIASLGFRGEALASISSVSRFTITSKTADCEQAYELYLEGEASEAKLKSASHPVGTTVSVRDLFFNTPVRRKFLRTDKTEFDHIQTVVKRMALSRFDIAFTLRHDGKTIFHLPLADNETQRERRVAQLFGQNFLEESLFIDNEVSDLHLWGWCAKPTFMRSSNDLQYLYINGRMVKDKLMSHAIRQAYQDILYEGRQAAYCLYLECDAEKLDVNVHPTKHEVRFREARMVHDFLFRTVARLWEAECHTDERVAETTMDVQQAPLTQHYNHLPTENKPTQYQARQSVAAYRSLSQASKLSADDEPGSINVLAILYKDFALLERDGNILCLNITAAQQALFYFLLKTPNTLISRPLLVPLTIQLDEDQMKTFAAYQEEFQGIKCQIETLGPDSVAIREIPSCFNQVDLQPLIKQSLSELNLDEQLSRESQLITTLSRFASSNMLWQQATVAQLCRDLLRFDFPPKNFLEKRIWSTITKSDLSAWLK